MTPRISLPCGGPGGFEQDPGVVAERDDGDAVVATELIDEQAQGLLDELEPALALHRARRVDDEGEGGVLARPVPHVACLEADPQQDFIGLGERGRAAVGHDLERVVVGGLVALVEGIDPFLDADAGGIRPIAVVDVALRDRVARGVDVEAEGRDLVLIGIDVRVDAWILVGDAAVGRRFRRRPRCDGRLVMPGIFRTLGGALASRSWRRRTRRPRWRARPGTGVACA